MIIRADYIHGFSVGPFAFSYYTTRKATPIKYEQKFFRLVWPPEGIRTLPSTQATTSGVKHDN